MPADARAFTHSNTSSRTWVWLAWGVLIAGLVARLIWYPVITTDYTYFVKAWTDTLASHPGLTAFLAPFSDYAPLYLYFLKALSFIPVPTLVAAKTLSLIFDGLIAYGGYLALRYFSPWRGRRDILFLAAVALFSLPTVMINSSLWGQSDSLYGAGVVFSFLFMLADAPFISAVAFGLAISMKVQAVFFAPVLIGYLLRRSETRMFVFIPPIIFLIALIPAWLGGADLGYWALIYAHQAGEYPYLSVSAQSIFAYFQPLALSTAATRALFWAGIALAMLAAVACMELVRRLRMPDARMLTLLALASALVIPYVLPRMHERYFYLADLFSLLYAFMRPGRAFIPAAVVFASLLAYVPFLSGQVGFLSAFHIDLRLPATILLLPAAIVFADLWHGRRNFMGAAPSGAA